jgi:hypothetical protein
MSKQQHKYICSFLINSEIYTCFGIMYTVPVSTGINLDWSSDVLATSS